MADTHAQVRQRETIELELVIIPTRGNSPQVDIMYFGYNELKRRGDDDLQYLQNTIRGKHPELDVDHATVVASLRKILREWHPEFDSQGRFTIQIPGALNLGDPAKVAGEDGERQKLQYALDAASRDLSETEEKVRQLRLKLVREQEAAEQVRQEQDLVRRSETAAAQWRAESERDDLLRQMANLRMEDGRLKTVQQELERARQRILELESQRFLDSNTHGIEVQDLLDQIEQLKKTATSAGNGPAWRPESPATGEHPGADDAGPIIAPPAPPLNE